MARKPKSRRNQAISSPSDVEGEGDGDGADTKEPAAAPAAAPAHAPAATTPTAAGAAPVMAAKPAARAPEAVARATTPHVDRALPPPPRIAIHEGATVELKQDQRYADDVLIRAGERGKALYPSSQAAAWVVSFPRCGAKLRVVPEPLLAARG